MSSQPRRKFDQDFKRNAVLLYAEPGRSVVEVAKNLGIGKDLLYRWRREYHRANGQYVFPKYCWLGPEQLSGEAFCYQGVEKSHHAPPARKGFNDP